MDHLDSTWKTDLRVSLEAGDLQRGTAVCGMGRGESTVRGGAVGGGGGGGER